MECGDTVDRSMAQTALKRRYWSLIGALAIIVGSGCSQGDSQGGSFEVPETKTQSPSTTADLPADKGPADKGPEDASSSEEETASTAEGTLPTTTQEPERSSSTPSSAEPDTSSAPPPPRCDDDTRNGEETDLDCGGPDCPACPAQKECKLARDCQSQVCSAGRCAAPTCTDQVLNGQESDIDCGGPDCPRCGGGSDCRKSSDCRSDQCENGKCTPEACNNDRDCAHLGGQCSIGQCDLSRFVCRQVANNEGQPCESGRACVEQETCQAGVCRGGEVRDCSHLQDDCTAASCNTATDRCETQSLIRWREDFRKITANNSRGWRSGLEDSVWRIGEAKASRGCLIGENPAEDHTPDTSNYLLGTLIGQCLLGKIAQWDCVYSPEIDLRNAGPDIQLRFWRHLQTQGDIFVDHKIIARNADGSWTPLFTGFSNSVWDSKWTPMSFSVKQFRHKGFSVGICLKHAKGATRREPLAGWSLDDFSLAPKACSERL